jgi:dTDP-4-amino-4,6-dideoxygalactose transaminase
MFEGPQLLGDPIQALDLVKQYESIRDEVDAAIKQVIQTQRFILGPELAALEDEIAEYCGVRFAVGCASGSDALLLPLMAWGVDSSSEVITTPFTFFATAGAIWRLGARPVFVDIDPVTYNIDPSHVADALTSRTRVILPVHLFGQAAEMEPILALTERNGLKVLEDSAQAILARYRHRRTGSLGDAAAFSFYPSKNLGGFGDGGMITTDDHGLARRLRRLRAHGMEPKYYHPECGINSRLDELQAAVLRVKLQHLETWTKSRREVAGNYRRLFHEAHLEDIVTLPCDSNTCFHVYNQFVIRIGKGHRDPLRSHLLKHGVGTEIYYPVPLHLQSCFSSLGYRPGDFPHAEAAASESLALPIYPELAVEAQSRIVSLISSFYESSAL